MQRRGPVIDERRPLWRSMLRFLVPLMTSNMLQSASATLNAIYLGRLIGVHALAAASAFFPMLFFMVSFFIGIASGATVLIGQAHGARNVERLKAVAGTTLAVAVTSGLAVAIVGWIFAPGLMRLIGTPPDVFADALAYARVMFATMPIMLVYLAYTTFVRGTGDARTPLFALVVSTALILVLTPALILGWLGPRLGVVSAAVANLIASALALGFLLFALAREGNPLAFDRSIAAHMRIDPALLRTLVRIGIPTGLQMVMVSLSEIAVIALVNRFGSDATAAYGAVNQIVSYVQFPAISIGIASSIFGAQSIGAGRFDRLRDIARAGVALNWTIGAVLIGFVYAFDRAILTLFVTDARVLEVAHTLLAITLWSYLIFGTSSVLSGLMRSSGTVLWPTLLAIVSIWGVEVPAAYALAPRLGLPGVWIAYPLAFLAGLAMQATYYFGFWRRKRLTALVERPAATS